MRCFVCKVFHRPQSVRIMHRPQSVCIMYRPRHVGALCGHGHRHSSQRIRGLGLVRVVHVRCPRRPRSPLRATRISCVNTFPAPVNSIHCLSGTLPLGRKRMGPHPAQHRWQGCAPSGLSVPRQGFDDVHLLVVRSHQWQCGFLGEARNGDLE